MSAAIGRRILVVICLIAPVACAPRVPEPVPTPLPPPAAVEQPSFSQTGVASWYGAAHHGRRTANGERFDQKALTAAHPSLALGSIVRVTSLVNGKSIKVRINDRGPRVRGRIIDLSAEAARALDLHDDGVARVKLEVFASDQ
jgi:rare lipoprotein A